MLKPFLILATLAVATPAFITPAFAATPRSDARLAADQARTANQANRVAAGIESGRLNPREAAYLGSRIARTDRATARLAADGHYSRVDAARIDRRQDTTSRRIARGKVNRR